MATESKTKFIPDIWITGTFNNNEIIGRTFYIGNKERVIVITDEATSLVLDYADIKDICKINFVDKTKKQKSNLSRKSVTESFKLNLSQKFTQN